MNQLSGMKLFAEVADGGSFSNAGRRLGMAPSSVSRQISQLEDELGARLLNRTTRKLALTEAGRIYYDRVRRILAEVEEANLAVTSLEAVPRGTLRVNAPVVFGRLHIAPHMPRFLERYPDVTLDLTLTDHFVDVVEEGADVVIRVGNLADSALIARRLGANRRVIVASPIYAERRGMPERPQDLGQHNCLIYKLTVGRANWHIRGGSGVEKVGVAGNLVANNAEALREAVLSGLGIALLPTWLVGSDIERGDLIRVLPDYEADIEAGETAIHAIYPHNRHLSAKVRAFVDFMVECFSPRPYWDVCGGA